MVTVHQTVLTLFILQIYVSAAPTDAPKQEEQRLEKSQPSSLDNDKVNTTESQRQNRYYDHFEFPPFAPPPFHSFNKRDQSVDTGVYGLAAPEDPLIGIHRRLQEVASVVRQSVPQPPPPPITPHFPLFFPVIYIPQCACEPTNAQTTEKPQTPPSTEDPINNATTPDIENRFPVMDDERQNWGLVADDTEGDEDGEDFSRPISFDPIRLDTSNSKRPAPPVEHGSNQAGESAGGTTTTVKPAPPSNDVPSSSPPMTGTASVAPYPPRQPPRQAPSSCDGAVLSCCHMSHITYNCFAVLGCPDPTSYGNPCDPLVILKVITKFQNYYGVKKG